MDHFDLPEAVNDAPAPSESLPDEPGVPTPVKLRRYRLTISTYGRRAGDTVLMDPELPWVRDALEARWLEPL